MTLRRGAVLAVWLVLWATGPQASAANTPAHARGSKSSSKASKHAAKPVETPATVTVTPAPTADAPKPTPKTEQLSRSISFDDQLLGARDIHYQAQFVPGVPWRTMLLTQPTYRFRSQVRLDQASVH